MRERIAAYRRAPLIRHADRAHAPRTALKGIEAGSA
jgi:hypothetical protein